MKKFALYSLAICVIAATIFFAAKPLSSGFQSLVHEEEMEGEDENENLEDRYAQLFEQLKDPALDYVPNERLINAITETQSMRAMAARGNSTLSWTERGPIYDSVGPSGNSRGGTGRYTSGIIQTFLLDTIADPTGNTILIGTPSGGLWKCTNLLSASAPNWVAVNDFMANLAIASICRDPSSPNIMYVATGDGNTRDVRGYGVWKSTDFGTTWNLLSSTIAYKYAFKILCDNTGNVYLATAGSGLLRSSNGGSSWTLISPNGLAVSNPTYVTDIEISTNGRLHAAFGYYGTTAKHYYTDNPATVSSLAGWNTSTGIRLSSTTCSRIEMASQGNTMYAVTVNGSYNIDSCYQSLDDGETWVKKNTSIYTSSLGSSQGWYAVTLAIDPDDSSRFLVGGLDAYRSINSGVTISKQTYWASGTPYVHADHHGMQWYRQGGESRILIACDGGLFMSRDGGATYQDKNVNLPIKQFYSCAMHPDAGSNFLFAGAQDNGCHQIKTPGKTYSFEVTGGDGAYVHINQQNPQVQFGSYIYNQYRRSTNGGQSWTSVTVSSSAGYFINPFDYDDANNILYGSSASSSSPNNAIRRLPNANTSSTATTVTISSFARNSTNNNVSSLKVSPYTPGRLFLGGNGGKLIVLDSAHNVTTSTANTYVTDITSPSFPTGYINCINLGTSEQYMVVTFTNYGVNNVWYTNNWGISWTAIDGNLPDMPVWWATFAPGSNDKLIIATETGIFSTDLINGAGTVWTADAGFPMVRTSMLKVRASDNMIAAATYGRGLFTAKYGEALPVSLSEFTGKLENESALLRWSTASEQNTDYFEVQKSTDGNDFVAIGKVNAAGNSTVRKDYSFADNKLQEVNYYRLKMVDRDGKFSFSKVVIVRANISKQNIWVLNNPFNDHIDFKMAKQGKVARLQLYNIAGTMIAERTIANPALQIHWSLPSNMPAGTYVVKAIIDGEGFSKKMIKQ